MEDDAVLEKILEVHDVKSFVIFMSFFIFMYIFGKCILNGLRWIWGWMVVSVAIYLLYHSQNSNELIQDCKEIIHQLEETVLTNWNLKDQEVLVRIQMNKYSASVLRLSFYQTQSLTSLMLF